MHDIPKQVELPKELLDSLEFGVLPKEKVEEEKV
jgi:hypothetical protein